MEPAQTLALRREALLNACGGPCLLYSGTAPPRNFAANTYRYRANSHFLYCAGTSTPGAYLLMTQSGTTLFMQWPSAEDDLWHGPSVDPAAVGAQIGCEVRPLTALAGAVDPGAAMTIAPPRAADAQVLTALLNRPITPGHHAPEDMPFVQAMVAARSLHDQAAIAQLRRAAQATARAFAAGRSAAAPGVCEARVKAQMVAAIAQDQMTTSFDPIVSVRGEILHNHDSGGTMQAGDLLLVDFGAETRLGWAADVTRTWPVSGAFSATQRALYQLVLTAEQEAIAMVRPGVRYLDVHLRAAQVITQGLVDLGILLGDVDGLVEDGIHAAFFPHGVGHLLGLDVHDMEDLGDLAGYAPGRARSQQFGLGYLRLDRDLVPGMLVTIEPGFYHIPALLHDPDRIPKAKGRIDLERLEAFRDVRGIRIEDDVLVTENGHEVLTASIPKEVSALEVP